MSQRRFALLVTLLAMGVAAVAFAVGLRVLDDGQPDLPPRAGSVNATETTLAPIEPSSTTSGSSVPPTTPPGALETPAWVTVVASEGSQEKAEAQAALVAAKGYPTGVLLSDDYQSLNGGHWVAFAGPYPDAQAAEAAVDSLAADGFDGAYVRCVGSKKECDNSGNSDSDDD